VIPPRPIDVKKLIAKRVFFGLSFGKRPSKKTAIVSSCRRAFSFGSPIYCESSWNRILMKIREDDVVVSSVIAIVDMTLQGIASAYNNCAKNFATFRNLFVSSRWIVSYDSTKISSKSSMYSRLIRHNRVAVRPKNFSYVRFCPQQSTTMWHISFHIASGICSFINLWQHSSKSTDDWIVR